MTPTERAVQAIEQVLFGYIDPYSDSLSPYGVAAEVAPVALAAAGIPWEAIATMPEDRKDGRQILLWKGSQAVAVRWVRTPSRPEPGFWDTGFASEMDGDAIEAAGDWWADIKPPEGR